MICRKRNFLFIHIPKTAGTSIEKVLFPEHAFSDNPDYNNLYGWDNKFGWLNHLTLQETISMDSDFFRNDPYVFTIVRNPWDRLVSEYYWKLHISDLCIPFSDFVRSIYFGDVELIQRCYKSPIAFQQHIQPQSRYFSKINERFIKVLKFDNFGNEIRFLLDKYNINCLSIPEIRVSKHSYYTHYYDKDTINMVGELYKKDIERFGFNYG